MVGYVIDTVLTNVQILSVVLDTIRPCANGSASGGSTMILAGGSPANGTTGAGPRTSRALLAVVVVPEDSSTVLALRKAVDQKWSTSTTA